MHERCTTGALRCVCEEGTAEKTVGKRHVAARSNVVGASAKGAVTAHENSTRRMANSEFKFIPCRRRRKGEATIDRGVQPSISVLLHNVLITDALSKGNLAPSYPPRPTCTRDIFRISRAFSEH